MCHGRIHRLHGPILKIPPRYQRHARRHASIIATIRSQSPLLQSMEHGNATTLLSRQSNLQHRFLLSRSLDRHHDDDCDDERAIDLPHVQSSETRYRHGSLLPSLRELISRGSAAVGAVAQRGIQSRQRQCHDDDDVFRNQHQRRSQTERRLLREKRSRGSIHSEQGTEQFQLRIVRRDGERGKQPPRRSVLVQRRRGRRRCAVGDRPELRRDHDGRGAGSRPSVRRRPRGWRGRIIERGRRGTRRAADDRRTHLLGRCCVRRRRTGASRCDQPPAALVRCVAEERTVGGECGSGDAFGAESHGVGARCHRRGRRRSRRRRRRREWRGDAVSRTE